MTGAKLWLCPEVVGQPSHRWVLFKSPTRLQKFHTTEYTTELILPTATCGQHLFEHQRTMTYLVLVPAQSTEVIESPQYGGSEDATGAKATACGDGREQGEFDARAEGFELGF